MTEQELINELNLIKAKCLWLEAKSNAVANLAAIIMAQSRPDTSPDQVVIEINKAIRREYQRIMVELEDADKSMAAKLDFRSPVELQQLLDDENK